MEGRPGPESFFRYHRQPLKTVYLVCYALSALCVRLPYLDYVVAAVIPALRPRRTWSMKRAFMVPLMRVGIAPLVMVGFSAEQEPEDVMPTAKDEENGLVALPPVEDRFIMGEVKEIAELNGVKAKRTFEYWYKSADVQGTGTHEAKDDELVYLNFHGGGYCMETPKPSGMAVPPVCSGLLKHCSRISRIISPAYRLVSSHPFPTKNPFPAALLDALAAYHYLLHTAGFRAENVIVSGDSAGGHLAVALLRYLIISNLPELPVPGALLLISPTIEWALTHDLYGSSWWENQAMDMSMPFLASEYTARGLAGKLRADAIRRNAWIAPASRDLPQTEDLFVGFLRTLLVRGEAETQRDAMRTFRDRLVGDVGEENVTYKELTDVSHDVIGTPWDDEDKVLTFKMIGAWTQSLSIAHLSSTYRVDWVYTPRIVRRGAYSSCCDRDAASPRGTIRNKQGVVWRGFSEPQWRSYRPDSSQSGERDGGGGGGGWAPYCLPELGMSVGCQLCLHSAQDALFGILSEARHERRVEVSLRMQEEI
ncbi:Alpha/Beta hydrolase protein [Fomitopsis serialis]|uniref:Alpha/Beta hydrolase protein n=1 Tax=Fomitopsis serialis TaxID=139415 RepID=UPI00200750F4|nr:Alpha/Beta hydrolase protein [Neoantrodia serialis]KAH9916643.1 Alpha/Beta hydrolase protein [Neoantrodia serialis]